MAKRNLSRILLVMSVLSLSVPAFSQDKSLIARGDSLYNQGIEMANLGEYERAIVLFEQAADIRRVLFGQDHPDYASSLNGIGVCYSHIGDYAKALEYYQRSLAIDEKTLGKEHPDYATSLNNIGNCYADLGDYAKALEYHQRALAIRENTLGKEHPDYATSLNIIGNCYADLGDYVNAIEYYQRSLAIIEKTIGQEHPFYDLSLNSIGGCYYYLGDYVKALEYYQRVLAIREKTIGKEHPAYATILNNIGTCYLDLGDYVKALECFRRELAISEKILGKDHPDYAASLANIGYCYSMLGEYAKALEYNQQALLVREKKLGKDHPDYATSLNSIGYYYFMLGEYAKALEYNQQGLSIREKTLGKDHPDYATSLNNIGTCYRSLGDYVKALEYHQRALAIRENTLGKEHPDYATSLNNIGNCYADLGDYAKALEYHQRALAIEEKTLGKEHPDYARSLNNIGNCYSDFGDNVKALEYHQRALAIEEKTQGKEHRGYATSLNNIGTCYHSLGDYEKALEYYQQSLAIKEKTLGEEHPDYATSLNGIGVCYSHIGDYAKALEYYQRSLAIEEKSLGKDHPDYAADLGNIGSCYGALGDDEKASECFETYLETTRSLVSRTFSSLTESQREAFWNRFRSFYTKWLFEIAAVIHTPIMRKVAYDGALFGKGLLLNAETEMRKLILESGDEESIKMFNEMQESRKRLDKIYENPVGKKPQIDSLNKDRESLQEALVRRCKVFGDYTRNLALKWTDVQSSLKKNDIAIEFETYSRKDTTFYIALTLKSSYTEPHMIELFSSVDLGRIRPSAYYMSSEMTDLVWGKLSGELSGVKNVYFSPAGELNNIAIEYLKDADGEHLVSEKRKYYRLTSTREIVKDRTSKKASEATVYGGILYDVSPKSTLTGKESDSELLSRSASRSLVPVDSLKVTRGKWDYLAGTKEEAEAISRTLRSKNIRHDLLEGADGTEESFKALSGARRDVIHIATHGFYWTEREVVRNGMESMSFILGSESHAPKEDKALTRSGLLFAGAKNTLEGKVIPIDVEDGILTAKDISRLDLRGTDMVVISACQSGLGEITGDGVFGLQRGFKKAGVKSIVMSLWEVNDEATRIMMTRFYENLAKGWSKYSSFQEAQGYLREYGNGEYDKPMCYAAFVLLDAIDD